MPLTTTAGQNGAAGSFTVINSNTPPNEGESNTVTAMQLALSCGVAGNSASACPSAPDPGVFAFSGTAVGAAGTACAGTTFTPSAADSNGIVTLTPSAPVVLAPPGGSAGSDRCRVDFSFNVLRVPSVDSDAPVVGTQTRTNLRALSQGSTSMATVTSAPSVSSTVAKATPALSTAASNASVGQAIRDTATLTGVAGGPTGSVTFNLYGPADSTCSGAAIFTSTNPIGAGGVATSGDFTPSEAGSYRWRASYSGDANHNALPLAACNSSGETSVVDTDSDGDGLEGDADNCPQTPNPDQVNSDSTADGGDACDSDDDNDGVFDTTDNCRLVVNGTQTNTDADAEGDACDADDDNDGVPDVSDAFPLDPTRSGGATNGDDILNGTPADDQICGLLGNDTINGLAANDTLFGDACGKKAKVGAAQATTDGNDKLNGGAGNDSLFGAGGRDSLKGGSGGDKLFGGAGNDTLSGEAGKDSLNGGSGHDRLNGGKAKNAYKGGPGNDTIAARNRKKETVDCGPGRKDKATVDRADKVKGCERVKRTR
jgi:Ca2+-binding RTX toxin-like protein